MTRRNLIRIFTVVDWLLMVAIVALLAMIVFIIAWSLHLPLVYTRGALIVWVGFGLAYFILHDICKLRYRKRRRAA